MKDSKDYFLADRWLTRWVIGLSIIGTNVGTNSYIGASGNAYSIGIAQANIEWIGAIPAIIICSLVFIPLYWKAGVYSIPEYLGLRYNQPVRLIAALIACIVAVFAIGVGMWSLALTLKTYIGWPIWLGILVSETVVGFYSISGGLAAVAITDSLQVCIMFLCSLIIMYLGLEAAGGVGLLSLLDAALWNYLSMALFFLLALLLWRVPKGLIETGSKSKPRYLDLRWWATALIAIQLAIYWVFN